MSFDFARGRVFLFFVLVSLLLLLILFPQVVFAQDIGKALTDFFNRFLGGILWASSLLVGIGQFLFLATIEHTIRIREVHTNTIEGIWTTVRNFFRPFRGVHKKWFAGYLAICEFRINLKCITGKFISKLVNCTNS